MAVTRPNENIIFPNQPTNFRKFALINEANEFYDFSGANAVFLEPQGLGFNATYDGFSVGSDYIVDEFSSKLENNVMSFKLILGYISGDPYYDFYQLSSFFYGVSSKYILQYIIPTEIGNGEENTFYRDVRLQSITKTEIDRENNGTFVCTIELLCTSVWYNWVEVMNRTGHQATIDSKVYHGDNHPDVGYKYPYIYTQPFSREVLLRIFNNSSYAGLQRSSALRVEVWPNETTGIISNPSWFLTNVFGEVIGSEMVEVNIPVGWHFVIDSDYSNTRCELRSNDGDVITEIWDKMNTADYTNLIRVPIGFSTLHLNMPAFTSWESDVFGVWYKYERVIA